MWTFTFQKDEGHHWKLYVQANEQRDAVMKCLEREMLRYQNRGELRGVQLWNGFGLTHGVD